MTSQSWRSKVQQGSAGLHSLTHALGSRPCIAPTSSPVGTSLMLTLQPPSYKEPCEDLSPPGQSVLIPSQGPSLNPSAKSLLPRKGAYSQAPGVWTCVFWGPLFCLPQKPLSALLHPSEGGKVLQMDVLFLKKNEDSGKRWKSAFKYNSYAQQTLLTCSGAYEISRRGIQQADHLSHSRTPGDRKGGLG